MFFKINGLDISAQYSQPVRLTLEEVDSYCKLFDVRGKSHAGWEKNMVIIFESRAQKEPNRVAMKNLNP